VLAKSDLREKKQKQQRERAQHRVPRDFKILLHLPYDLCVVDVIRWDEKAGLRRDAIGSQVIDALEAQEIKETGNEED
jgi:hypothetical protein